MRFEEGGQNAKHEMTLISSSVEQTEAIAAELSARLTGGQCIALCGDLGAGKTQFVRGLVRGLGGNARAVSSPTYILLNVYDTGRLAVYHLDAYRVSGPEDFEAIGFAELLEQGGVVVVEWAERVWSLLPPDRVEVRITALGEDSRQLEIRFHSADTSENFV
jgi:tRNA threonylcarbamoyladenosine biosynthesis protein TsaE